MSKQFFDSPIFTDTEDDVFFRQKMRMGLSDIASVISLLQDDFNKQISSVRSSILLPSSTLGGNVTLSPATATRNVILPTAVGATNLVLKAIASQTAKALEIQSSAGAVVGSVTVAGVIASMTWNGVTIGTTYGGTGLTSYTAGDTLYSSAADTLAKLPKGTADQLYGMNAGATIPEWKGVTVTLAGAMAGVTTLGAVGPVTLSAGGISVADTYGMYSSISSTDRNVIRRNSTTLEVGVNGGWTGATYTIASGSHVFAIGAINYFQCSTSLFQTAIDAQINGTFRATGAGQFDSTLLTTGTARFSSRVGIGGASNSAFTLYVTGSGLMSGTEQTGVSVDVTGASDGTAVGRGLYARFNTAAASYTVAIVNVLEAAVPVIGAGSAITDLRGVVINGMTGATNNYGLFIEAIAGGTINRAIHTAGGDHVFVGNVRIGSTTAATVALDVTGAALISSTLGVTGLITANGGITLGSAQVFQGGATAAGHAFGATSASSWLVVSPTSFTSSAALGSIAIVTGTINGAASNSVSVFRTVGTIVEAGSGVHPILAGAYFGAPTITAGVATATDAATVYVAAATSATVTGFNYGILSESVIASRLGGLASGGNAGLTVRAANPAITLIENDQTTDETVWAFFLNSKVLRGRLYSDDVASNVDWLAVTRGTGVVVSDIAFSNSTDNAPVRVLATTDATSISTGSQRTAGGASVTKALWVGGLVDIAGASKIAGNAAFFGTGSFGSGTGVMSIINASVNPSANPTGGGILYADAGALKWRGSSGTTTTIAAA